MKITQITVSASTGFNHPFEQFSNFKPGVTLTAQLDENESAKKAVDFLQARAHEIVMAEKQRILDRLQREVSIEYARGDLERAQERLKAQEKRLPEVRDELSGYKAQMEQIEPALRSTDYARNLQHEIDGCEEFLESYEAEHARRAEAVAKCEAKLAELQA